MALLTGINYLAVFVSAIVYFILGFLWYSVLFAGTWRKETGIPEATAKPSPGALIGQFISTYLFTLGIAVVLKLQGTQGVAGAIVTCALVTVLFAAPIHSGNLFFTGKKKLFLLDVSERAIGSLVVGIILSLWQ
jgi:hypothetical protein